MKQKIILFFFTCVFGVAFAQKPVLTKKIEAKESTLNLNDSTRRTNSSKNVKYKTSKIQDYLIISHKKDTTFVDTTLTLKKEYKFNYLRRDNFELLAFSNVGQSYNTLGYNFKNTNLMPNFGARARHFNYMEIEDIKYYHVPTPLTELYFKTAFEQGQQLDAFFAVNLTPQLNFSIAYKGLRSLGKYQHIITSTGNFRFTTSYKTKNKRYVANAHITMQDLFNEENGGLKDDNIIYFETGEKEFKDRGVLEVNFEDADNILKGKRFHLDHYYNIIKPKDSIANNALSFGHIISFEDKYFEFNQDRQNDYFGESITETDLKKRVTLENFYNQVHLNYSNKTIGNLKFNVNHNNYNYGYDNLLVLNQNIITNRLKGDILAVGGSYSKTFKKINFEAQTGVNVSGDFDGNFVNLKAAYALNNDAKVSAQFNHSSQAPNYNFQLYQSKYINYNWQNSFNNLQTQQINLDLESKKLLNLSFQFATINHYTYFEKEETTQLVKPFQNQETITYLKVTAEKDLRFRNFGLLNTIQYQNVKDEAKVFPVPEFITRNTLYYQNHLFKKALLLQTGVTFNYFTKYHMKAYDPVLAEFYVQNEQEYGAFPRLDFFINAKIRQARIFLKAEHFNSAWTGYNFYSAPNYPYRDFAVRFGLVWNFFL